MGVSPEAPDKVPGATGDPSIGHLARTNAKTVIVKDVGQSRRFTAVGETNGVLIVNWDSQIYCLGRIARLGKVESLRVGAISSVNLDIGSIIKRASVHVQNERVVKRRTNDKGAAAHVVNTPALSGASIPLPLLNVSTRSTLSIQDIEIFFASAVLNRNGSIRVNADVPFLSARTIGGPKLNVGTVGTRTARHIQHLGSVRRSSNGIGTRVN